MTLTSTWPLSRGHVVTADIGLDEPKLFVVVSNNRRNRQLRSVLGARITTSKKPEIASIVVIGENESVIGSVVCDDIVEIYQDEVLQRRSALSPRMMFKVSEGLAHALGLNE